MIDQTKADIATEKLGQKQQEPMTLLLFVSAGILMLCLLVVVLNVDILTNIIGGPLGVLSNLALLAYVVAGIWIGRDLGKVLLKLVSDYALPKANWRELGSAAVISIICLIMAGESVSWFSEFYAVPIEEGAFKAYSVRDVIAAAFTKTPDKIDLNAALMIGMARLVLFAVLIYGAGYAIYYKDKLAELQKHPALKDNLAFVGLFIALMFIVMFAHAQGGLWRVFESGADLCASLCVLLYVFVSQENKKAAN